MFYTDDFNYKNRVFTAEASDFPKHKFNLMFPPNPGVISFVLVSSRTGNKVKMLLETTHRDREDDITHWEFIPYDNTSFDKLVVFND